MNEEGSNKHREHNMSDDMRNPDAQDVGCTWEWECTGVMCKMDLDTGLSFCTEQCRLRYHEHKHMDISKLSSSELQKKIHMAWRLHLCLLRRLIQETSRHGDMAEDIKMIKMEIACNFEFIYRLHHMEFDITAKLMTMNFTDRFKQLIWAASLMKIEGESITMSAYRSGMVETIIQLKKTFKAMRGNTTSDGITGCQIKRRQKIQFNHRSLDGVYTGRIQ